MSIRVSEKHGVNPSIPACYYCNETKNEVVLFGRLPNDKEAPMNCGVIDMAPCSTCEDLMSQGVLLISVRNGDMEREEEARQQELARYESEGGWRSDRWKKEHPFNFMPNPYRTGVWVIVTEDAIRRAITGDVQEYILRTRWAFVPDEAWDALGLPREGDEIDD